MGTALIDMSVVLLRMESPEALSTLKHRAGNRSRSVTPGDGTGGPATINVRLLHGPIERQLVRTKHISSSVPVL